jgi:tetratricopeptide (TPR) repeat protein
MGSLRLPKPFAPDWRDLLTEEPRRVSEIYESGDFYKLGVVEESREALAATGSSPGKPAPYIERDVDDALRSLLRKATERDAPAMVVISGPPLAGKSRTLAHALSAELPDAWLLTPRDRGTLIDLGKQGGPRKRFQKQVIWLDDLERFVASGEDGLNAISLGLFGAWRKPPLIVATAGGKGLRVAEQAALHSELQAQLLSMPEVDSVALGDSLSDAELARLRELPDVAVDTAEHVKSKGIGAYMLGKDVARLLLDVPAAQPVLGFEQISRALAETVMQSDPRFAIGIFGGWGSGKTTLMQAIKRKLDPREVVSVPFVAWRYEKEKHLIVPLLDVIREALLAWANEHDDPDGSARATAATIGRVVRSLVAGLTLTVGLPGAVEASFDANSALQEHSKLSEDERQTHTPRSFYHASFKALEGAFKKFAGGDTGRRIVVFVDDLDRCLPKNALQVLESMKLFFDLDGFVFVVGLDDNIIEYAVQTKYPTRTRAANEASPVPAAGEAQPITGREYIKKVFQLPYRLKPVSVQHLELFIQAASQEANLSSEQRRDLRGTVEGHLRYMVGDGTVNPREVKRYINLYTLQTLINPELDRNALLALQTISFRQDWETAIWSRLMESREQYLDAVSQRLAYGAGDGDGDTGEDFGFSTESFPEDFLEYVGERAPGRELLLIENLDAYLSLGEAVRSASDPALREAINEFGQVRSLLHTAHQLAPGSDDLNRITTELLAKLNSVQGRVAATSGGAAQGRPAVDSVRVLREKAAQALERAQKRNLVEYKETIRQLRAEASLVAKRLWRLYRLGDVARASVDGIPEPPVPAATEPLAPSEPLPTAEAPTAAKPTAAGVFAEVSRPRPEADGSSSELRSDRGSTRRRPSTIPASALFKSRSEIGPYELGVRPSFVDSSVYVPRDIDRSLQEMLSLATREVEPRAIVLTGPPLAGKTRTAYEALVAEASLSQAVVLAPRTPTQIAQLLDPNAIRRAPPGPLVFWLDDLDRLEGIDERGRRRHALSILSALRRLGRAVLALGTLSERRDQKLDGAVPDPHREDLSHKLSRQGLARILRVEEQLSTDERERMHAVYPSLPVAQRSTEGIGALLMGRQGLQARLQAGQRRQPEGTAIVRAALDWVRAGTSTPVGGEALRSLWPHYLEGGEPSEEGFARGLDWALAPGPTSVAPLLAVPATGEADGRESEAVYEPHPLVLSYEDPEPAREIDPNVWDQILALADDRTALSLGMAAVQRKNLTQAAKAFMQAESSPLTEIAGAAGAETGKLLLDAGLTADAEAAFVYADEHGDAEGAAKLAQLLEERGDLTGAEEALRHADERGHSTAAVQLGRLRESQNDLDGAIAAYRRADERSDVQGTIALARLLNEIGDNRGAEQALRRAAQAGDATANFELGLLLQQRGDFDGAEPLLTKAAEQGNAPAAQTLGLLLERQGKLGKAIRWQRRAAKLGDQMAAYNLGRLLYQEGKHDEGKEWLRASTDPLAAELLQAIGQTEP